MQLCRICFFFFAGRDKSSCGSVSVGFKAAPEGVLQPIHILRGGIGAHMQPHAGEKNGHPGSHCNSNEAKS